MVRSEPRDDIGFGCIGTLWVGWQEVGDFLTHAQTIADPVGGDATPRLVKFYRSLAGSCNLAQAARTPTCAAATAAAPTHPASPDAAASAATSASAAAATTSATSATASNNNG